MPSAMEPKGEAMRKFSLVVAALMLSVGRAAPAQPAAPSMQEVKKIPPPGVEVPASDREQLQTGVTDLGMRIDALRQSLKKNPAMLALLPDVQIYHNAVRYALEYNEFFAKGDIAKAKALLKEGLDRADALKDGQAPWTKASGLVVKGYVSRIDGSVQPYGLVIPPSYSADPDRPRRLDIWYHGRGETLSEISFLADREKNPGQFTPPDTIVLQPYGRYCNANRFAGEVDTFEALDNIKSQYVIDPNRVLVRGFSMGGASCWMFATHHPGLWAAAAPGAGFTETAHFLHIQDLNAVPWYQRKLWHWYDSIDYAMNLYDCPVVAYSGAADPQKQAADEMDMAMAAVGLHLEHVIGPGSTKHFYHPAAKAEVSRRIDLIADHGRDPMPAHLKFVTWTLKYNRMRWLTLDGLERHWEQAQVDAVMDAAKSEVQITTANVTALTLSFEPGSCPFDPIRTPHISIDAQTLSAAAPLSDKSWEAHFLKLNGKWEGVAPMMDGTLHKRHDLQGPIDDAFMNSFVMVKPTGTPMNEKTGAWAQREMKHAVDAWRAQFRGEARVKDDASIDNQDFADGNLILWGDPSSNAVLKRIAEKLPIRWDAGAIHVGEKTYPAGTDVPVMIYPNPLNPSHYVVLNSGFTFREMDYLNNARQTPKLPDWAIVDTSVPPSPIAPGKIVDAGFFGERWELLTSSHQ
jgi:pimeloyl-ACP methyl ester carboxylesterase